ncbi:MAG: anion permease, partial [Lancefieldella sp.]
MITFGRFLDMIVANPFLAVVIVLIFGCIFVNGATDAANAIAESVGTRSIKVNNAIAMSVICNFVGLVVMCIVSTAVADTIIGMVDFGTDYHQALIALAAGCVGIVTWAVGAWALGIPTSESHALIAGLTGAALALHGNFDAVNWDEWSKVIIGLIFSTISGFIAGWVIVKIIHTTCKNVNRKHADSTFGHLQVLGSAFVAMMHGAQDGQKFLSIAMLAIALSAGAGTSGTEVFPLWLQVV